MLRLSVEGIALFLLPFLLYAVLLALGLRFPWLREAGAGSPVRVLATIGFGLVVLGLVALGLNSGRSRGAYVPAHMEHGTLVPGRIQ